MRLATRLLVVSLSFGLFLRPSFGEEARPGGKQPRTYTAICRIIDEENTVVTGPEVTFVEGQKVFVADQSQSPFVTGLRSGEGEPKPIIQVLEEGTRIELTVFGAQPGGATVDVTVERARITDVDTTRVAIPQAKDGHGIVQSPRLDTQKKRVVDFFAFSQTIVIPLGTGQPNARGPRVEVVVTPGKTIPADTFSRLENEGLRPRPNDVERNKILNAVLANGAARVTRYQVSRWQEAPLVDDLHRLAQDVDILAGLYREYWPHRPGAFDAGHLSLARLCAMADRHLEEGLGYEGRYVVELADSPSLVDNIKLLSRCPGLWGVTIVGKEMNGQGAAALERLRHLPQLKVSPERPKS